jgi:uroporphyrinogen-III synthase
MDSNVAAAGKVQANFNGRRVLSFESRRANEIATLIATYGGQAIVAPATREVAAGQSEDVPRFVTALLEGKVHLVIFLTGVGARALVRAAEACCPKEKFLAAISQVPVLARGPKPVTALKELNIPISWNVPEPNTWREILSVLDGAGVPLCGRCVAVQEYGVPSRELLGGLRQRGAEVMPIHVYDWALPEDVEPLENAIRAVLEGRVDIVLFTAGVQVHHLIQVAESMKSKEALIAALKEIKIASIGPVTSEGLAEYGLRASMEPSHPKMGYLVREAAELVRLVQ